MWVDIHNYANIGTRASRVAADVDDLVAESFARMLSILKSGVPFVDTAVQKPGCPGYADPAAPSGVPYRARVSGATIPVRGKVIWAGLYWSGSGSAPAKAKAHFWVPGKGVYKPVKAQRIDRVSGTERTRVHFGQSPSWTDAFPCTVPHRFRQQSMALPARRRKLPSFQPY